jgi:hypothetical protein
MLALFGYDILRPSALWLLLLIPPLVALYFLKLKRPRLAVPSLVLWQQVVNDNRVNSPFQRFKRNILLLLQLLLLLLLILAATEPFRRGGPSASDRLPILIDRSASMGAVNEQGESRLDLAKKQVLRMIDNLGTHEELSLIAFSKSAQQVAEFTNNKRVLRAALDAITLEDVGSDLTDALRMADALARTASFERVLLMSDGNFPEKVDFELPFKLDYPRLEPAGANMGITALNARRATGSPEGGGGWNVFVNVQATEDYKGAATLELVQDGEVRGTQQVAASVAGQRLVFDIAAGKATSIEVRLRPDAFDSLQADNVAFLELAPLRPLFVYVPKSLQSYRSALQAIKDVRVFPPEGGEASAPSYDLVITDKPNDPPAAEWRTALHVGYIPADLGSLVQSKPESTGVIDWRRTSPLLEHVELSDVVVLDQVRLAEGAKEGDLENLHYEVITYGRHGPLMLQKREGQRTAYYLLFHTDRSTLPYRVGFPIMVTNLVRAAMQEAGLLEVAGDRTGVLPAVTLTPGTEYQIKGPNDFQRSEKADAQGVLAGVPAPRVGRYVVSKGEQKAPVGVSLLQPSETLLQRVAEIHPIEGVVKATATPPETNKPLWLIFALTALAFLLIEWWFFQRKPGGWGRTAAVS